MDLFTRMRSFIDVVNAGGFSSAARKTNRSKALLSKQVRELENELGVLLLQRTTRQLSLTKAGQQYYERAEIILKEVKALNESVTETNSDARGTIKISASRTFADAPIGQALIDFLADYPQIHLDLHLDDRFVDLVEEGFDLAIRLSILENSSLIARKLCDFDLVIVASPTLLEKVGTPIIPSDLAQKPCLVDRNNRTFNSWVFESPDGNPISVDVHGPITVNSPVVTKNAALTHLGFARLPRFVAEEEIKNGSLVAVLDEYMAKGKGIYVVYPHRQHMPARVRIFVDTLAKWFKNNAC